MDYFLDSSVVRGIGTLVLVGTCFALLVEAFTTATVIGVLDESSPLTGALALVVCFVAVAVLWMVWGVTTEAFED